MPHYPRLPELPPATEPETATQYGLRVLAFVLVTQVTATLSDEALRQADHAFPIAVSNPEISILAAETLAECRRLVCAAIARRSQETAQETAQAQPAGQDKPNIGPGARLQPAPVQQPPAGSAVRPVPVPVPTREQFAF